MIKVCLAVSAFRNDLSIQQLLLRLNEAPHGPFFCVIIVDSLGTGEIQALIAKNEWKHIHYHNYKYNLGSAGNLAERLKLAEKTGADYVYALNHDGDLDLKTVETLLDVARNSREIGAIYPLHYKVNRKRYDLTGVQSLALPLSGTKSFPPKAQLDVHWNSSNGALFSLTPVRQGLLPWADLWMGWEDMAYGWLLKQNNFRQVVVTNAIIQDPSEYRCHRFFGRDLFLTDKPAWYAYYQMRNLILITRRYRHSISAYAILFVRITLEFTLTTLFRSKKFLRYRLLSKGIWDGMRNKTGKGALPLDPIGAKPSQSFSDAA